VAVSRVAIALGAVVLDRTDLKKEMRVRHRKNSHSQQQLKLIFKSAFNEVFTFIAQQTKTWESVGMCSHPTTFLGWQLSRWLLSIYSSHILVRQAFPIYSVGPPSAAVLCRQSSFLRFAIVAIGKPERQVRKVTHTLWQQAALEVTRRDHSIIACSCHKYGCFS